MECQWQTTFSPDGYTGPSFRRGLFVAAAQQSEAQLCWHIYRVGANESLERLWSAELIQGWNAAESVEFPRAWTDDMLAKAGWS